MADIVESSPYKIVANLVPERRQSDMFGNTLPHAKVIVRTVNPHHLVVQLLAPGQSEDSFRLLTSDEKTPFLQSDFQVRL